MDDRELDQRLTFLENGLKECYNLLGKIYDKLSESEVMGPEELNEEVEEDEPKGVTIRPKDEE